MPRLHDSPDEEAIHLAIGKRIRRIRRSVEMSQKVLASKCGITFQQVQKYESAETRITASRLVMIAEALGCDPGWLLTGRNPEIMGETNGRG